MTPFILIGLAAFGLVRGQDSELETAIPGIPGEDYPLLAFPLDTTFICDDKISGYYADLEGECQQYHICASDGAFGQIKYSFLCPNGTLFNQQYFICDWWFNVDCSQAENFYDLNAEVAEAAALAAENNRNGRSDSGLLGDSGSKSFDGSSSSSTNAFQDSRRPGSSGSRRGGRPSAFGN